MILSILICHLKERKELLERLMKCLEPQIIGKPVEVLIDDADKSVTTGEKRNRLLARATGRWSAAVDDDDLVSESYCEKILKALETEPDCTSLNGILYRNKMATRYFYHSIKNGPVWREKTPGGLYLRPPNHISPVRTELARQAGFPNKTSGEDADFSKCLFPLLKTEVDIPEPIYYYHTR